MTSFNVTITVPAKSIEKSVSFECAAWYESWFVDAGIYTLNMVTGKDGTYFEATVPATLDSDNFQSYFGGCAIGEKYDNKKNAGKQKDVRIAFSLLDVLKHQNITVADEQYDQLVELLETETKAQMDDHIASLLREQAEGYRWVSSFSGDRIAKTGDLLSNIRSIKKQRAYSASKGYKHESSSYLKRDLKLESAAA
jgi:hypothetical protein